jgi:tetratricopeptide (TPR) repeat protein
VRENLTALLLLYIRPVAAIGQVLDHGRLWFAILVAILVSIALQASDVMTLAMDGMRSNMRHPIVRDGFRSMSKQEPLPPELEKIVKQSEDEADRPSPSHFIRNSVARFTGYDSWSLFSAIWAIAIAVTPGIIALRAVTGYGSFSVMMRRDYLSLLMCVLLCWSAVYLLVAVAQGIVSYGSGAKYSIHLVPVFAVAFTYFLALTVLTVRSILGTTLGSAIGLTIAGAVLGIAEAGLFGVVGSSLYFLASPFVLFYAWRMLGSEVASLGDGLRGRQHFQQQLEIATTNPRDADAHYQLGLIYQQRRQYTEAIARFTRAVEIDPSEAEAQFQLGRIAREQGRFDDAIRFLKTAAALNDKLSANEVWRELGAAYAGASRFQEAADALAKYTDRRSYDPEGLFWYGKALAELGRSAEARTAFEQCIEAVDTMPKHRRAEVRKWKGLAKTALKG